MKLFIITGQTSTGKTERAIELAHTHTADIVNFDSRQIYQYLDIITNKDLPEAKTFTAVEKLDTFNIGYYTYQATKIWLYDIVKPNEYFSPFDFAHCALETMRKVIESGRSIILVGGTYFYLYHLLYDVNKTNTPPNFDLRNKLKDTPVLELQKLLKSLDEESFRILNQSDQSNPQRLIRKIEILKNGSSRLEIFNPNPPLDIENKLKFKFQDIEFMGFHYKDKKIYKEKITKKVNQRLETGAIEEVKRVLDMGFSIEDPGLKTIGYKQLISFIKGEISKDQAIENWINAEMQYAKRQYTFMKRDLNIHWRTIS